jgi:hypothetical protein
MTHLRHRPQFCCDAQSGIPYQRCGRAALSRASTTIPIVFVNVGGPGSPQNHLRSLIIGLAAKHRVPAIYA